MPFAAIQCPHFVDWCHFVESIKVYTIFTLRLPGKVNICMDFKAITESSSLDQIWQFYNPALCSGPITVKQPVLAGKKVNNFQFKNNIPPEYDF